MSNEPKLKGNAKRRDSPYPLGEMPSSSKLTFDEVYARHRDKVYGQLLRYTQSPEDAEDMLSEVFLKVWKKLHTFRGQSQLSTWIYRVALNEFLMSRRKKRLATLPIAGEREEFYEEEFVHLSAEDAALRSAVDRQAVAKAMAELRVSAPGYHRAIVMHEFQGYEHQEIAALAGCSVGNSKSQLHKAKQRMAALLS